MGNKNRGKSWKRKELADKKEIPHRFHPTNKENLEGGGKK